MKTVIKIGTSTIAHANGRLNIRRSDRLTEIISDIKNAGNDIVIVSSGAIGMGVGKLGLPGRPADITSKQAAAAVGQCELMYTYDRLFARYSHTVAQILLTASDFSSPERYENFRNTVDRLLELGVIPVINENDSVATEEIKVGDNDTLSARVAVSIGADLLILLSDIDGLYTSDPKTDPGAKLIRTVDVIDEEIIRAAGGRGSALGTGGMKTKLDAAAICMEKGCDTVIANGRDPEILYRIFDGTCDTLTLFRAPKPAK